MQEREATANSRFRFSFYTTCIFAVAGILIYFLQFYLEGLGFTNFVFVDGVTWLDLIYDLLSGKESFSEVRSSWLLFILFCPFVYLFGTVGSVFLNSLFLGGVFNSTKVNCLIVSSLFFLFFFVSSLLPGKEVVSLILTFYFIRELYSRNYLVSFLLSLVQLLIRDGSGLIFFIFMLLFVFCLLRVWFFVAITISLAVFDLYLKEIQSVLGLFLFERTMGFFEGGEWQSYLVRVFANATNLGSRFSLLSSEGNLSITGFALWFSGVGVTAAVFLSCYKILKSNDDSDVIRFASFFVVSAVLLSSISPLIQPRYLIPFACSYLFLFYSIENRNTLISSIVFSFVFLLLLRLYYIFSVGLPVVGDFYLDDAFFLSKCQDLFVCRLAF